MEAPFFSIIVPAYNAGTKIDATIRSVIEQEGASFELIVMDGGSKDNTLALLRRYADEKPDVVRWKSEKDAGVYDAMNKGIDLARGKFLYFLGAGDKLRPGVLRRVYEIAPRQGMAFIYGGTYWVDRNQTYNGVCSRAQLSVTTPCHQAIFYERSIFDLFGKYELKYRTNSDWAMNIRCFGDERVEKRHVDMVIADYEGGGMSGRTLDKEFAKDRRRLAAEYLQVETTGYLYFMIEQTLAIRIENAKTYVARKFWHGQLWLLHNIVRPLLYGRLYRRMRQTG